LNFGYAWQVTRRQHAYGILGCVAALALAVLAMRSGTYWLLWAFPIITWLFAAYLILCTLRPAWFHLPQDHGIPFRVAMICNTISAVLFAVTGYRLTALPNVRTSGASFDPEPLAVTTCVLIVWIAFCAFLTARYRRALAAAPTTDGER